jgi:uncharacterized membrane protein
MLMIVSRQGAATLFAVVAVAFGLAMVFVTPPFQVPDEVGHYWHAYAIATGVVAPARRAEQPLLQIPQGARDLVAVLWVAPGAHQNFRARLRTAGAIPHTTRRVTVEYRGFYTPIPYVPQAIACATGEALRLRPIVTFYLGRVVNLLSVVAIIVAAIRIADELAWPLCVAGLLPMSIFLFASYSADAVTIALAFLATALAREQRKALGPVAFLLGLCKPPYLLIVALALTSKRRSALVAALAALLGAVIALPFETDVSSVRTAADPAVQMHRLLHEPVQVAGVIATDVRQQGSDYLDELVGRLGWLDIALPRTAYYLCLLMLLLVALTSGVRAKTAERLSAAAILVACIAFIELSQFVIWTPPASDHLEGVQGRYFLPLLPLFFVAVSRRARDVRWVPIVVAAAATIANGGAIVVLLRRYFLD